MDLNEKNTNENERLDENAGFTEFPGSNTFGTGPSLSGRFAAFFKSFFGTKGKPGRPAKDPYRGDVVKHADGEADGAIQGSVSVVKSGGTNLPQVEYERRRRYHDYEKMDEYPEIGAALDIYADDATQSHLDGSLVQVETEDSRVKDAVDSFIDETNLDKYLWDIIRNMCKYGDCFVENIVDMNNPDAGIQRLKILNPVFIFRREDRYGYLKGFIQEVPASTAQAQQYTGEKLGKKNTIQLDRNQLVHFRLHTSDSNYYPYGKSICAPGVRAWRSLRMCIVHLNVVSFILILEISLKPKWRCLWNVLKPNLRKRNFITQKVETLMRGSTLYLRKKISLSQSKMVWGLKSKLFQELKTWEKLMMYVTSVIKCSLL